MRQPFRRLFIVVAIVVVACAPALAQTQPTPEQRTSKYFESIRSQPLLLAAFLRQMPKGADLHMHISGSIYAESYLQWAAKDGLCIDRKNLTFVKPPCDTPQNPPVPLARPPATLALTDSDLSSALLRSMSVLGITPLESGHDHFFNAFGHFPPWRPHTGEILAEILDRAADNQQIYVELMYSPVDASPLGDKVGWNDDFSKMRASLLTLRNEKGNNELPALLASITQTLDAAEQHMRTVLGCGTERARPGCHVQIRYLYQGYRTSTPEQVFAQFLTGFELAKADPRFVGINFVAPEDSHTALHDFALHMRMLDYLHAQYPQAHISLHAGELAPGLVPPEDLRHHIRDSIERGHAERIGHGVDVIYENEPLKLLQEMAQRKVLVEICLSSNDYILGVRGAQHPLPLYLKYGVPVAIATDDLGVARSDLTREYQRAVEGYGLTYAGLKRIARLSLEHSFLPGRSMWADFSASRPQPVCAASWLGKPLPTPHCNAFLHTNERAYMEWVLEGQFAKFEAQY